MFAWLFASFALAGASPNPATTTMIRHPASFAPSAYDATTDSTLTDLPPWDTLEVTWGRQQPNPPPELLARFAEHSQRMDDTEAQSAWYRPASDVVRDDQPYVGDVVGALYRNGWYLTDETTLTPTSEATDPKAPAPGEGHREATWSAYKLLRDGNGPIRAAYRHVDSSFLGGRLVMRTSNDLLVSYADGRPTTIYGRMGYANQPRYAQWLVTLVYDDDGGFAGYDTVRLEMTHFDDEGTHLPEAVQVYITHTYRPES